MSLRVVRLAAGSFLQDRGRPGWRRFGVPPGGAFDREAAELALALVGRSAGPVLEILLMGGEFEGQETDRIALVGAEGPARLDGAAIAPQSSFPVRAGQRLRIEPFVRGARAYLASARGWSGETVLGSYSNQPVLAGPGPGRNPHAGGGTIRLDEPSASMRGGPVRFLPGPQARASDLAALAGHEFRVGLQSNRLGVRLEGGAFEAPEETPSEPSVRGAVQLTPSGELIVHGPDGPTVGGYPKIAVVIDADFDRLAQLRPGDAVCFEPATIEEARTLAAQRRSALRRAAAGIRSAFQALGVDR